MQYFLRKLARIIYGRLSTDARDAGIPDPMPMYHHGTQSIACSTPLGPFYVVLMDKSEHDWYQGQQFAKMFSLAQPAQQQKQSPDNEPLKQAVSRHMGPDIV